MHQLDALERTLTRVKHRRRVFNEFAVDGDLSTEQQPTRRKLAADLKRAEDDAAWIQTQIEAGLDIEGLNI